MGGGELVELHDPYCPLSLSTLCTVPPILIGLENLSNSFSFSPSFKRMLTSEVDDEIVTVGGGRLFEVFSRFGSDPELGALEDAIVLSTFSMSFQ